MRNNMASFDLYHPICDSFKKELLDMNKEKREETIKWTTEKIKEIDEETFSVNQYINHPIRFWFNEYQHVILNFFND